MHNWDVELAISGPIKVPNNRSRMSVAKGDYLPFQTNLTFANEKNGVNLTVGVLAENSRDANDAAVYFVGRAIDALCLATDLPIHVSTSGPQFRQSNGHTKRIIHEYEWSTYFEEGRRYGTERPTFARALSWFRKGHTSEDPIDKFIAYWNSIEVVGSKYAIDNERTRRGVVNKVCNCFDQLWGDVSSWEVIPNDSDRVSHLNEMRNGFAHGTVPLVDLPLIREATKDIPLLHRLAHRFLSDWQSSTETNEHFQI